MKKVTKAIITMLLVVISTIILTFSSSAANEKWIAAWGCAPTKIDTAAFETINSVLTQLDISLNQSVTTRSVITPTANGTKVRFVISNRFGTGPLQIESMSVAKSLPNAKIEPLTASPVTYNGRSTIVVPAGKDITTDPVEFAVNANEDIAVSIFVKGIAGINTMGLSGGKTFFSISETDMTRAEMFTTLLEEEKYNEILNSIMGGGLALSYDMINVMPCVVGMDVYADESAYSAVVIGDSTVANNFPLYLAQSIHNQGITNVGIAGKGIFGNKLLTDGLGSGGIIYGDSVISRLDYDALFQSGVEYVILKVGVNDIVHPVSSDRDDGAIQPTVQQMIEGYRQVFEACHKRNVKVIVVGITQWKGSERNYLNSGPQYIRTEAEFQKDWEIAEGVNQWLSSTKEHDGFVSLNEISASAKDSAALDANYTADGVHPTAELQKIWADYFPTSLLGVGNKVAGVVLDKTSTNINKGETVTIKKTVHPSSALNKKVTWQSLSPEIATVDSNGKVTGIKNGKAVIVCITDEGGYTAKCTVTVTTKATGIKLPSNTAEIYTTKGVYIKATALPEDASDKTLTYKSSDTSVATVNSKGYVKGVGKGEAKITITNSAGKKAVFTITVKRKIQVTDIELSKVTAAVYTNKTFTLDYTVYPEKATFKDVEWVSSDESVAEVDKNGVVTGIKAGKARITCKSVDNPMVSMTCIVTVKVKTEGVKLDNTTITVYTTTSKQLTATVLPKTATNKNVTWESENSSIASVDKNGLVKGKKVGTTYITVTTNNSKKVATCKVVVKKGTLSKSVTLNKSSISIYDGKTYTLKATLSPSNTTTKTCLWTSSNEKVAKVSSKGVVTGIGPGTAVITCKTKDTGKTVKCTVTVKKVSPASVTLEKGYYQVGYQKTLQLKATVSPSNATNKTLIWKSSNPKYVKVNSKGVVTGLVKGKTVTITVTTEDGKKADSCEVYVGTVAVTSVKLNKTFANLKVGGTYQLRATVYPEKATDKKVTWESDNENAVKVNSSGKITAVGRGTAFITCSTKDGNYIAICTVVVS